MFLGHFGAALATRGASPSRRADWPSLGTMILASQWLDLIWPVFLLVGIEQVRVEPGLMEASALDFVHYPYTHSLLAALVWGVVVGGIYWWVQRHSTGALIVGGLVVSHWFLDVPVHRPDLPLWPGSGIEVGAGLWHSLPATVALEMGVLAIGLIVYLRSTHAVRASGSWGLWAMVGLLVAAWFGSLFGPPPPDPQTIALAALSLWLFVAWGYWIDRGRTVSSG